MLEWQWERENSDSEFDGSWMSDVTDPNSKHNRCLNRSYGLTDYALNENDSTLISSSIVINSKHGPARNTIFTPHNVSLEIFCINLEMSCVWLIFVNHYFSLFLNFLHSLLQVEACYQSMMKKPSVKTNFLQLCAVFEIFECFPRTKICSFTVTDKEKSRGSGCLDKSSTLFAVRVLAW